MARIAMVEDDAAISELVRYNLETEGHAVTIHRDGERLLRSLADASAQLPELVLLDVMLPGLDGFAVLEALRRNPPTAALPVLMLTARGTETDKVRGLESGADDYLAKPFGIRELSARIHALLRRSATATAAIPAHRDVGSGPVFATAPAASGESAAGRGATVRASGDVLLDDARHRVFRKGVEVPLTHREYELLRHLMLHAGIAFSRDELLKEVWGYDFAGETRTVDVHVRQLRLKLGDEDPASPLIETVRGRGYRFREERDGRAEGVGDAQ